jgi:hypothetical protein
VKAAYFSERRGQIGARIRDTLELLSGDEHSMSLSAEAKRHAEEVLDRMIRDYGYCKACARACLGELQRTRYADV